MKIVKLLVVLVLGCLILAGSLIGRVFFLGVGEDGKTASVYVYPGDNARMVASRVDSLGLMPVFEFKLLSRVTSLDKKLKVGRFDVDRRLSGWEFYKLLRDGMSSSVKVTIPEGLTVDRIVPILADAFEIEATLFDSLLSDQAFLKSVGIEAKNPEGYIFPETYLIPWGSAADYILSTVILSRRSLLDSLGPRMKELGFDEHKLLTFASLIEAEARDGDERTVISSVYHNRLNKRMLLQCDPTVIYALGGLERRLLLKDLEVDSPYNTYKYKGLPPGPICSPGRASIEAALYPDETDYLYFVADGSGGHVFSKTLAQHNQAREKIKTERRRK